jgi:cytosine/adenosine deaminase-related metal-dependent hydrolase
MMMGSGVTSNSLLIINIEHGLTGDSAGTRFCGCIRVRDGVITELGQLSPQSDERLVDARGTVVTPGLVNTHHHLFQSLLKAVPEGNNEALDVWLQKCPYAFWPFIDAEVLKISAQVGLAELVLSGATTVCDHHYVFSEHYEYDPVEVLFAEAARFGVRFVLARGGGTKGRSYFNDPSLPPTFKEPLSVFLDGVSTSSAQWHDASAFAMTRMAVAPTTPVFNIEPDELPAIAQLARDLGLRLHSHLSENATYVNFIESQYGMRPVQWLATKGWTGDDVWYAHLVDIDDAEILHIAESGTCMAHCVQANARLGSGIAPADKLFNAGGVVSIGVDGAGANEAADMGAAMYACYTTHRAAKGVDSVRAESVLHWATEGGAKALGYEKLGRIAPGMAADIALFDLSHPRNMGLHDPTLAPVVTGAAVVRDSFVAGNPLVVNGRIPWLDLHSLRDEAQRVTHQLIAKRRSRLDKLQTQRRRPREQR